MPLIATFLLSYLKFVHAANYYIFIIMKKHVVGRGKRKENPGLNLSLFMSKDKGYLCDSGIGITWVHVSRLPTATAGQ